MLRSSTGRFLSRPLLGRFKFRSLSSSFTLLYGRSLSVYQPLSDSLGVSLSAVMNYPDAHQRQILGQSDACGNRFGVCVATTDYDSPQRAITASDSLALLTDIRARRLCLMA